MKMMYRHIIACDVGGTKVEVGLITLEGEVTQSLRAPVRNTGSISDLVRQIADMVSSLDTSSAIPWIGIAAPGPIRPDDGIWKSPTNISVQGEVSLKNAFQEGFSSTPFNFVFENDAAAALVGEHWIGSLKDKADCIMATLGTGLGVGVFINGKILRAGKGYHPEPGHWIVDIHHSEPSTSSIGASGSAESLLSGTAFEQAVSQKLQRPLKAKEIIHHLRESTLPEALPVLERYRNDLARYLFSLSTCFMPEAIALGGSFAKDADLFLEPVQTQLQTFFSHRKMPDECPNVYASTLSNAGLIGAAKCALNRFQLEVR